MRNTMTCLVFVCLLLGLILSACGGTTVSKAPMVATTFSCYQSGEKTVNAETTNLPYAGYIPEGQGWYFTTSEGFKSVPFHKGVACGYEAKVATEALTENATNTFACSQQGKTILEVKTNGPAEKGYPSNGDALGVYSWLYVTEDGRSGVMGVEDSVTCVNQ